MSVKIPMFVVLFVVFPVAMMTNLPVKREAACSCPEGVEEKVTAILRLAREIELICQTCPTGWVRHGESCYYVDDTLNRKSQADARTTCQKMGGDLAIIKSDEENDFISNLIPNNLPHRTGAWIGLKRNLSDMKFYWIDGTPLTQEDSKWRPGQPDNASGGEHCVHLFGSASGNEKGMWNDLSCDGKINFVCEKSL